MLQAEQINAALPQTQCTRCGYPDCASYAQAIAALEAPINQCPPGGAEGIARLARITGQVVVPLNPTFGVETSRAVACPTDAILGSNKRMHTVIEAHCTGCELCLPVCPVDCIQLVNASGERTGWDAWSAAEALNAQARYSIHSNRRNKDMRQAEKTSEKASQVAAPATPADTLPAADSKQATIAAALARARARRQTSGS